MPAVFEVTGSHAHFHLTTRKSQKSTALSEGFCFNWYFCIFRYLTVRCLFFLEFTASDGKKQREDDAVLNSRAVFSLSPIEEPTQT